MPNTKSAKKRMRQSEERRLRNRAKKSELRTQVKKVREAMKAGDAAQTDAEFRALTKKFDQAAAKGVIHANTSSRVKSRLSARIKAAKTAKPVAKSK